MVNTGRRGIGGDLGVVFNAFDSGQVGFEKEKRAGGTSNCDAGGNNRSRNGSRISKTRGLQNRRDSNSEVHVMSLQRDGSYGFQVENEKFDSDSWDLEAFEFDSF